MMTCKPTAMTFEVYEIYPDGREHNTNKTLHITKEESDAELTRRGWGYRIADGLDEISIVLLMFERVYGFSIGMNGFALTWEDDKNAIISWGGPREPAIRCGGSWWRLKRIT